VIKLQSILTPARTLCRAPAGDKQQVLEHSARFIGAGFPALDAAMLFNKLMARERLGSTGLGNGIAIPHCRLAHVDAVVGALITLQQPIEFNAVDDKPVDVLFVLLAPEQATQEHLNALAALAELFNESAFCEQLRVAQSAEQLYRAAVEFDG
jgi:PTS system nitrogen regulatory IIA component